VFLVDSGGEAFQHSHQPAVADAVCAGRRRIALDPGLACPTRPTRTRQQTCPREDARTGRGGIPPAALCRAYPGRRPAGDLRIPRPQGSPDRRHGIRWPRRVWNGPPPKPTIPSPTGNHDAGGEAFEVLRLQRIRPEAAKAETARAGSGPEPAPATETLSIPSDPLPPPARLPRPLAPSGVSAVLEDSADVPSRSPFADGQSGSAVRSSAAA
jgi:ATP-dependent helicase/nuclease subunit A